jgi:DNA modification methylase
MYQHKAIAIEALIPYALNSRTHSDVQVAQLAASIREFGFTNPVLVDEANNLIAGHGRVMAARKLGLAEVPAIVVTGMDDRKRRALIIADNKLALNAGWDEDALRVELEDLAGDFGELMGFSEDELAALLADAAQVDGQTDEDEVPEAPAQPVTVLGDVWLLGKHRVMCGDSTSVDAVDVLMAGNKVDLVFTDPPYNVAFNGRSGKHDVIANDDLTDDEFDRFIGEVLQTIKAVNAPAYYIWCNWKFYATLQRELEYKSCIVWAKNVFGMGNNYRHQHEFCLFNGSIDPDIKNESDLWQVKKDTNYVHPTQKPVELSERALGNHRKAKNILDLFGGSGSTLIGCEKMNRRAFVMELDPKYVDVIVKRWQEFTGKQATLKETGQTFAELAEKRAETHAAQA